MWQHFLLAISLILVCSWFSFGQQITYTQDPLETIRQKVEALYPEHEIDQFTELFWERIQTWRRESLA